MTEKAAVIRATAAKVSLAEFLKGRPSRNVITLKNGQTIGDALQARIYSCLQLLPLGCIKAISLNPIRRFLPAEEFSAPHCWMRRRASTWVLSMSGTSSPPSSKARSLPFCRTTRGDAETPEGAAGASIYWRRVANDAQQHDLEACGGRGTERKPISSLSAGLPAHSKPHQMLATLVRALSLSRICARTVCVRPAPITTSSHLTPQDLLATAGPEFTKRPLSSVRVGASDSPCRRSVPRAALAFVRQPNHRWARRLTHCRPRRGAFLPGARGSLAPRAHRARLPEARLRCGRAPARPCERGSAMCDGARC